MDIKTVTSVFRIAGLYTLFGGLWIIASDRILEIMVKDPHSITEIQTYKGWIFVVISALLISLLISREFRSRMKTELLLRNEQKKNRMYIDVAEVILVVVGADERVKLINRKGAETLGVTENEIVGKNWFDSYLPEQIRADARNSFRALLDGKKNTGEYDEQQVRAKNGAERTIAWKSAALLDEEGKTLGMLELRRRRSPYAIRWRSNPPAGSVSSGRFAPSTS